MVERPHLEPSGSFSRGLALSAKSLFVERRQASRTGPKTSREALKQPLKHYLVPVSHLLLKEHGAELPIIHAKEVSNRRLHCLILHRSQINHHKIIKKHHKIIEKQE